MMVRKATRKLRVQTKTFKQGERVTIHTPKIDLQGLQCQRLPGIINRVMENEFNEVMTSGGTINRKFRVEDWVTIQEK